MALLTALALSVTLAGCLGTGDLDTSGTEDDIQGVAEVAALETPTFLDPILVDETRAGGEPILEVLEDGTLLMSAHAGTTHYESANGLDPDFVAPYTGQTYIWRSTDGGTSWDYIGLPETDAGPHGPSHGFSDPDFATDAAGNVYHTELYLAQASVSKSTDGGKTWLQGNPAASHFPIVDRQWITAGAEDVVYLQFGQIPTGEMVMRSTDGGVTFPQYTYVDGSGPVHVHEDTGTLYQRGIDNDTFSVYVSNDGAESFERHTVVEGREFPRGGTLALDEAGNLYAAWQWANPGEGHSVYTAASTDGGETWTSPTRVSPPNGTYIWPRIVAGDPGRAFVAWFGADQAGDPAGMDAEWHVGVAQSVDATSEDPAWTRTRATDEPWHEGDICHSGLACMWGDGDRRMGDLFDAALDPDGRLLVSYGATTMTDDGEAISHPVLLKQSAGVSAYEEVDQLSPLAPTGTP